MTYKQLYIWLQQRAALSREIKYAQVRPRIRKQRLNVLNTTHVSCRPSKGTSNLDMGVYRVGCSSVLHFYNNLDMMGRHRGEQTPRLIKIRTRNRGRI